VKLLYAFPEPLPLRRARGIQAVNSAAALAEGGIDLEFAYVPVGSEDPFAYYGVPKPARLKSTPISRSLPWPLGRLHSNKWFAARLLRKIDLTKTVFYVRHLKLAALLAANPGKPRFIYEAHEVFADTAPAGKALERREEELRVMRSADAIVSNSGATAKRLIELYGNPKVLEVIPNGVARSETLPQKDWTHPGDHIIYSGSLFPWKGAADLVTAAASLPGCTIEIIGGESDRLAELQAGVIETGAKVRFTGHLPHAQALGHLYAACIAVLPNRADTDSEFTSPIKLFEYMAAGCAIVASDLPPMHEVLDKDDALWTRPGDPQSIASAISVLVQDPALARRLGDRVREKSRQFTWQARAERVKALLAKIGEQR